MMEIVVDRKEVKRYLGYGRTEVDSGVSEVIENSIHLLEHTACPKFLYQDYPLMVYPDKEEVDFTAFQTKSKNLTKNLKGCERVVLFAATLGIQVDQLIARYSRIRITEGVVLQAAAAAMVEEYCDICQAKIGREMKAAGWYMRPRFSPGYGDFPLDHQKDIVSVLQCPKKIGLTVTDSLLLAPVKSVTAIIGLSRDEQPCHKHGCEECKKMDCQFRR